MMSKDAHFLESDIYALQARLVSFNRERDWDQFHSPRNLAMSLSVEAAELLEHFLWVRDGEGIPDEKRGALAEEAADVLICLLNLCTQAGLDLPAAFEDKLMKNAKKYPVEKAKGSAKKYNEL